MEYRELSNGVRMPVIGYGVFQIPSDETECCVRDAFEVGRGLFDLIADTQLQGTKLY